MPDYKGSSITNILNRENISVGSSRLWSGSYNFNYYLFLDFLNNLSSPLWQSSPWVIAGLLTNHMITSKSVKKQILFKKINGNTIAAIINITQSEKPGLNDKYKNKIIFFGYGDVIYEYDVKVVESTIQAVGPLKIGEVGNFAQSLSTSLSYVVDPNKVENVVTTTVDWFGGISLKQIEDVINTSIIRELKHIQNSSPVEQEKLPKINGSPLQAVVAGGGKRRTNNNNYAITSKITRVYRNKWYRSKRHSRVNLKRNLMNDKRLMVMTSSKRHSRTHRRRISRRK